jgi:predicted RNA-binding protein with PIN domain
MDALRNDGKQVMLLDGYNVMHRLPRTPSGQGTSLEKRRNLLAAFIAQWKNDHKYKGSIYLVFDGNNNQIQTLEQSILHGIKCIYSDQKEEADDKIIGIIRNATHPENITVISDDNFIANNVRSYGAYIKPVAYLLQTKKKTHAGKHKGQSEKKIDAATALRITDHMKKVWGVSD